MNQLPRGDTTFLDQTKQLVSTVNTQRVTIDHLRETNAQLKRQYDELAERHRTALEEHDREMLAVRGKFERELHDATTARAIAERKVAEVNELLGGAAELIMQGCRAMAGDEPPQQAPARITSEGHLSADLRRQLDSTI